MRRCTLIIGGGEIGAAVALRVAAQSHRVVMAIRDEESIATWNHSRALELSNKAQQSTSRFPQNVQLISLHNEAELREAVAEAHCIALATPGHSMAQSFAPVVGSAQLIDALRPDEEAARKNAAMPGMPVPPPPTPIPRDVPIVLCSRGITPEGRSALSVFQREFPSYTNVFCLAGSSRAFAVPKGEVGRLAKRSDQTHESSQHEQSSHSLSAPSLGARVAFCCTPNATLKSRDAVAKVFPGAEWMESSSRRTSTGASASSTQSATGGSNMRQVLAEIQRQQALESNKETKESAVEQDKVLRSPADALSVLCSAVIPLATGAGMVAAAGGDACAYHCNAQLSLRRLAGRLELASAPPLAVENLLFEACTNAGSLPFAFGRALVQTDRPQDAMDMVFGSRYDSRKREVMETIEGCSLLDKRSAQSEPEWYESTHSLFEALFLCTSGYLRPSTSAACLANSDWSQFTQVARHPLMDAAKIMDDVVFGRDAPTTETFEKAMDEAAQVGKTGGIPYVEGLRF